LSGETVVPLIESELRELHRIALRRIRHAYEYEQKNNLPSAFCTFVESFACLEQMFEFGLSEYFMHWETFTNVIELAYQAQLGVQRTKRGILNIWPERSHLLGALELYAATRVSMEGIIRFAGEDVSQSNLQEARRHLRNVVKRMAETTARLTRDD
jgi:hypothetical protein